MATKKLTKHKYYEKVKALFDDYLDTTGAILDEDLIIEDGTKTELEAADKNFLNSLEALDEQVIEDFDELLEALDEHEVYDDKSKMDKILKLLDDDYVREYANGEGSFILIKCDNMLHRDMIEEFVKEKIYTGYNEQQVNIQM